VHLASAYAHPSLGSFGWPGRSGREGHLVLEPIKFRLEEHLDEQSTGERKRKKSDSRTAVPREAAAASSAKGLRRWSLDRDLGWKFLLQSLRPSSDEELFLALGHTRVFPLRVHSGTLAHAT
jgi:hypothetical protein